MYSRHAQKRRREERRRLGLCVYCGRPAILKGDGQYACRCEDCTKSHLRQKQDAKIKKPIEDRAKAVRKTIKHTKLTEKDIRLILDKCREKAG